MCGRAVLSSLLIFRENWRTPSFHYSGCATLCGHLSNSRAFVWLRVLARRSLNYDTETLLGYFHVCMKTNRPPLGSRKGRNLLSGRKLRYNFGHVMDVTVEETELNGLHSIRASGRTGKQNLCALDSLLYTILALPYINLYVCMYVVEQHHRIDWTKMNVERLLWATENGNEWDRIVHSVANLRKKDGWAVASLGLVSPGAATEGVIPTCFLKSNWRLFSHHRLPVLRSHPYFFSWKKTFCSSLSLLLISLGCHPPAGCHPTPFYLSDIVCPLFFVNLPTIFFRSGVTPRRMSPGTVHNLLHPLWRHCGWGRERIQDWDPKISVIPCSTPIVSRDWSRKLQNI